MTSFLRSLYPTAQASCSRRTITTASVRYSSTSVIRQQHPSAPASSLARDVIQPDANDSINRSTRPTPIPEALVEASELSKLAPKPAHPDDWWNASFRSQLGMYPGNQYTGRSVKVLGTRSFQQAYRQVMGVLSRTGTRKDVRDSEYFEKPHVMRNRKKSERHRRRFQEMVGHPLSHRTMYV